MCGLSGVIHDLKGKSRNHYDDFMKDFAVFGTVRGEHSTGIFQRDAKGTMFWHKSTSSGPVFMREREAHDMFNDVDNSPFTVLHHRAATVGNIAHANAHPFEHYSGPKHKGPHRYVLGSHNGRISNYKREEDGYSFVVDSDWAMYQIFKHGAAKGVGMLEGDMALVWTEEDANLYMYCNGAREFHLAFVKDENAILFGSEAAMLHMTATRNGIELEDPILTPDTDIILVIDPMKPREFKKVPVEKKPKPVVRQIQHGPASGANWPMTPHGSNGAGGSERRRHTFQNQEIDLSSKTIESKLACKDGQIVEFFPDFGSWAHLLGSSGSVVGDCIFSIPQEGKPDAVMTHYAMMLAPSNQAIDSMRKASKNGSIQAKVIGVTNLIVPTEPRDKCKFLCAILTNPTHIEYGDEDGSSASAEIVINDEVVKQREMELVDYDVDEQMAQLDEVMGIRSVPGPGGLLVPLADFAALIKGGCACCSAPLDASMARRNKIGWKLNSSGNDDPLCESCTTQLDDAGMMTRH